MANELLDFVMALVRDPAVAARYAADPDGVLADAGLSGVTSVDVNNLLPVVSDSLAMAAPPVGDEVGLGGNVWTGGAATAAFDAFTPHHVDVHNTVHDPVIAISDTVPTGIQDPWFTTDQQVSAVEPTPAPVIGNDPGTVEPWDVAVPAVDDPYVSFDHHHVDDLGFSGFEPND